jgi:NAD(P)H dehydrogenase (quinone)
MAKEVNKGIEKSNLALGIIKMVAPSSNPELQQIPVGIVEELTTYDGIAFGSPVYFGNISSAMSTFVSKTTALWSAHALEGMPAMVFMSAGSGAGRELALQSFWNSLAVHGMVLVSNGIRGTENIANIIPHGNSVLGTSSLGSLKQFPRPSKEECLLAEIQGSNFAKVALALRGTFAGTASQIKPKEDFDIEDSIKNKKIILPMPPKPDGNYTPYSRAGNLIFISQVAFKEGKIRFPGKIGTQVTEEQAKQEVEKTMLNVVAVLKDAVGGDLNKVKHCIQLTGFFNTVELYKTCRFNESCIKFICRNFW